MDILVQPYVREEMKCVFVAFFHTCLISLITVEVLGSQTSEAQAPQANIGSTVCTIEIRTRVHCNWHVNQVWFVAWTEAK